MIHYLIDVSNNLIEYVLLNSDVSLSNKYESILNKNIYVFSGLGADERVFQHLDFSSYNAHFIKWISVDKNESIEKYAKRLLSQIEDSNPILIGLSFGGIMAIELSNSFINDSKKINLFYENSLSPL